MKLNLEPKEVFTFFEKISEIPRGSKHIEEIGNYLVTFARERNLEVDKDTFGNVIIVKDGSDGRKEEEPIILQGHIDMVCVKDEDVDIDMQKEGPRLKTDDNRIYAEGTSLGADDGIAVAYILSILDSDSISHPPIEAVFTADEEIGMLGADGINTDILESLRMINLDSEEEGHITVGCAGGVLSELVLDIKREPYGSMLFEINIEGLTGGHSGMEIDKERANANVVLGRVLSYIKEKRDFRIVSITGGEKDNTIPIFAKAVIAVSDSEENETIKSKIKVKIRESVSEVYALIKNEYKNTDPLINISATEITGDKFTNLPMDEKSTNDILLLIRLLPNGIQKMSTDVPGFVETSLNMGMIKSNEDKVSFYHLIRSGVESEIDEMIDRLKTLAKYVDADIKLSGRYNAWEINNNSELTDKMRKIFVEKYGKEPIVHSVHAGLECGIFVNKMHGLDVVSIGPDMENVHTTSESLDIESTKRVWDFLLEVLKQI